MKRTSILNCLLLVFVLVEYAWFHRRSAEQKAMFDFLNLRVVGYRFECVDATTGKPIPTLADIKPQEPGPGYSISGNGQDRYHLSARWVGHLPETVAVIAPGYKPRTVEIGDYPETYQKLELTPQ